MSLSTVRAFLGEHAPDIAIIELADSTATVAMAAAGHGVLPAQIAKTLALIVGGQGLLVVVAGDARLDNAKARAAFGSKARMMTAEEVAALTGHPIGGVCPFGLATPLPVHCDVSLRPFEIVIPAAGSPNSAVRIAPERMAAITGADWVDVCRTAEPVGAAG